jgi:hypothetical protein
MAPRSSSSPSLPILKLQCSSSALSHNGTAEVGFRQRPAKLELADAGFGHTLLCEFRGRLLAADTGERLLARVLAAVQALGLLKALGRQRTDATHVLAAVRDLNRIELVAETLRDIPQVSYYHMAKLPYCRAFIWC